MTFIPPSLRGALLLAAALTAGAAADAPFEVLHVPRACYRGEPSLWVLAAHSQAVVRVTLDEVELLRVEPVGPRTEIHLALASPGILRMASGDADWSFRVLAPEESAPVTERDSRLYADELPAVLLVAHRHPPRHDRTWETVRFARSLVSDTRPVAARVVAITPQGARALHPPPGPNVPPLGSGVVPATTAPMAGCLRQVQVPTNVDAAAIVLPAHDLVYGLTELDWVLMAEWSLQALEARGVRHRFLVVPPPASCQADGIVARAWPRLRLAARGNGAALLDLRATGTEDRLAEAIRIAMEEHVLWRP